jgi:hypothetical protein
LIYVKKMSKMLIFSTRKDMFLNINAYFCIAN